MGYNGHIVESNSFRKFVGYLKIYHNLLKKKFKQNLQELETEPMRLLRQERDRRLTETDWWVLTTEQITMNKELSSD